ncbi:MAG: dTMP kinase, partial [Elusimicrobia bacterium]|nr:dTMP kinase [Elusimicrobiota bacterium]
MRKRGVFITLEGTDGVGKTTQTHLLCRWLKDRGHDVVQTREPGGGAAAHVAERIREILLDPVARMAGMTELFLYEAARAEHVEKVIRPALEAGKTVVCDRYIDSTTAYQGQARSLPMKAINTLNAIATQGIKPDLTILLNLPARVGLQKALARAGN